MNGACEKYGEEERCIVFLSGNVKEDDHLEDLDIEGKITLKYILKKQDDVDWI
jgi:hypothetical protein